MFRILVLFVSLLVAMPALADKDKGKNRGNDPDNCGQQANEKGLKGKARKDFMKACTQGEKDERDDKSGKSEKDGKGKAEQERAAKEKAEQERIAKEKAAKQPTPEEKMEQERQERVRAEREKRREDGNRQVR
jgi:hypothetical protein